mmetsp:Transcript_12830/g.19102  ORF Transcript_12830/g.19102 Transcript_12830/m.19102 type:complete len:222 (-) Transcript_12830:678-1343(-)
MSQSPVIFTSYDFPPSFPTTCSVYSTSDKYLVPIIFCFRPPNRVKPPARPLNPSLYFIVDELEYNNSHSPSNSSLLTAPPPVLLAATTLLYVSLSSSPTTSNTRSCSNSLQSNPHRRRPSSSPILSISSNSSNNSTFNSLKSSSCCCCSGSSEASSSTSSNKSSIASANLQNPSSFTYMPSVPGAFSTRPTNTSSSACDKSPSEIMSCNSPQRFNSASPTK